MVQTRSTRSASNSTTSTATPRPRLSRAEQAKAYRARKKAQLGDAVFKAEQAAKRKERRNRHKLLHPSANPAPNTNVCKNNKQLDTIIKILEKARKNKTPINLPQVKVLISENKRITYELIGNETCDILLQAIYEAKKKYAESKNDSIKIESVKTALNRVRRVHRNLFGKETKCDEFEWLRDTDKVLDFIMTSNKHPWKTRETRQQMVQGISSILSVIEGFESEYKFYSNSSTKNRKKISTETDDSKVTDREANILPWKEIKTAYKKAIIKNPRSAAIMAVYTLHEPRRNKDYSLMRVAYPTTKLNKEFNYVIVGKEKNTPQEFVFNNYKTAKKYGSQRFDISKPLAVVLQKYIKSAKLKENNPLFGTKRGTHYATFSRQISDAFEPHVGKRLTANLLRHSFVSNFLNKKNLTMAQRKEAARKMSHSLVAQLSYSRVNIDELMDDDDDE